jgi:hypothetical protein
MKRILLLFLTNLILVTSYGQSLVPNGGFEQYSGCPSAANQLDSALFWTNPHGPPYPPGGSPDYFNQCSAQFNVPNTPWGYQPAHSGVAYGGVVLYSGTIANYREYLEVSLTDSLIANQCYHLEFYYNASGAFEFTSDAISAYFSDSLISGVGNVNPLPYFPQVNNTTGNYTDTLNWILVQGNFTASGGENYLVIGNFKNDAATNVISISQGPDYSYVYIDDVSLMLASCTGIEEHNLSTEIKIYPNPVGEEVMISCSGFMVGQKAEIKVTDMSGKEIYKHHQNLTSNFRLPASNFHPGIYFLEIRDEKNNYRKKFFKN